MKKPISNSALVSWIALNEALRDCNEDVCKGLLKEELSGRKRTQFLKRIHSRLNKVRATRERQELTDPAS